MLTERKERGPGDFVRAISPNERSERMAERQESDGGSSERETKWTIINSTYMVQVMTRLRDTT